MVARMAIRKYSVRCHAAVLTRVRRQVTTARCVTSTFTPGLNPQHAARAISPRRRFLARDAFVKVKFITKVEEHVEMRLSVDNNRHNVIR